MKHHQKSLILPFFGIFLKGGVDDRYETDEFSEISDETDEFSVISDETDEFSEISDEFDKFKKKGFFFFIIKKCDFADKIAILPTKSRFYR